MPAWPLGTNHDLCCSSVFPGPSCLMLKSSIAQPGSIISATSRSSLRGSMAATVQKSTLSPRFKVVSLLRPRESPAPPIILSINPRKRQSQFA